MSLIDKQKSKLMSKNCSQDLKIFNFLHNKLSWFVIMNNL